MQGDEHWTEGQPLLCNCHIAYFVTLGKSLHLIGPQLL